MTEEESKWTLEALRHQEIKLDSALKDLTYIREHLTRWLQSEADNKEKQAELLRVACLQGRELP